MFSLNENSKVIIYGAATSGKIIFDILKKNKIDIISFIDKRADELTELYGKQVVSSIEDIEGIHKLDCIVIIAVKNVFEHSKIASKLVGYGIKNILYKPYTVLMGNGSKDEKRISECYDCLLNNEIRKLFDIPETRNIFNYQSDDWAFVREQDGWIWAKVPVCLIYANKATTKESIWANIPILAMFPHIGLFQSFLCSNSDAERGIEDYVSFCCEAAQNTGEIKITERWKQNVVHNRLDVFHNMDMAYELDKAFFIRNAPRAEWNEAGYFNLLGGKHRATFLVAKGDRYIVLQIAKEDYKKWVQKAGISELEKRLNYDYNGLIQKGIIEHPYFYRYPFDGESFTYLIWVHICNFLARYLFSKNHNFSFNSMTAFVSLEDQGYIARNFTRIGVKVFRKTENRPLEENISEVMNVAAAHYLEKEDNPKVNLAVVEDTIYESAQFCFLVSDLEPGEMKENYSVEVLFQGTISSQKKFLYLIASKDRNL